MKNKMEQYIETLNGIELFLQGGVKPELQTVIDFALELGYTTTDNKMYKFSENDHIVIRNIPDIVNGLLKLNKGMDVDLHELIKKTSATKSMLARIKLDDKPRNVRISSIFFIENAKVKQIMFELL